MATIGQALLLPEEGWRRYDNKHSLITYEGTWGSFTTGPELWFNGEAARTNSLDSKCKFTFYGSKLRVFGAMNASDCSTNIQILVDGTAYNYSAYSATTVKCALMFEKLNLDLGFHTVEVTNKVSGSYNYIDAIDIDTGGYLAPYIKYKLQEKTLLQDMNIGDIISCRYTAATSGKVGYFSEFGACEANFIDPQVSSATPDGKFYFVKVSDDKLIADRNVQHSITWSELNSSNIIDGDYFYKKYITFEKPNSYIWFDNALLKNNISSEITVNVSVHKKDWTTGVSTGYGERIFSSTQAGGFSLCYDAPKNTFTITMDINGYKYLSYKCDAYLSGNVDLCVTYAGGVISLYIDNILASTLDVSSTGVIGHGGSSWFCIGAEPGSGSGIEPGSYPSIINAKISKFCLFNKCMTPQEIPDIITGNEEGLIIGIDPNYSSSNFVKNLSSFGGYGTVVGCGFESDDKSVILTVPTGGVAYSEMGEEVFPVNSLSSDDGADYKLTASSCYSETTKAYKAFNKANASADSDCWHSLSESKPWLKVDFKDTPKVINGLMLTNRLWTYPQYPISCEILGSNDDISYTSLFTTSTPSGSATVSTYTFNNDNLYRYYKLMFTSGSSGYTAVGELVLYNKHNYNNIKVFSYTNQNQGGWPINNDWDKYIWKSNLDGKITPSDSEIWNYSKVGSICKERLISGVTEINGATTPIATSGTKVSLRGYVDSGIDDTSAKRMNYCCSATASTIRGFRPMLVLKEGV